MTCTSPPALTDTALLAYLDGEADSQVVEHVERCAHCHARAGQLARLQDRLTGWLFRATCPSPEELGEYHLRILSAAGMAGVAQHVDICPHCRREMAQLQGYLRELAPALDLSPLDRVRERVRVFVARLAEGGGGMPLALAPVPAGIRGEEAGSYIYQADDVEVVLEIQADAGQADRKVILGLITGLDEVDSVEVHAWRAEAHVATVAVDELGNFIVAGLEPATYDLIVSGPQTEIHIQNLAVGVGASG